MKKVIFILAFMLMGTYVNANSVENPIIDNEKTELIKSYVNDGLKVVAKTVIEKDICTVTVTVTRDSDGKQFSSTASNNKANCKAAADAAEENARLKAAVLE